MWYKEPSLDPILIGEHHAVCPYWDVFQFTSSCSLKMATEINTGTASTYHMAKPKKMKLYNEDDNS